ncbi:MAG: EutN/CcmL family microcompartment protein [Elusimicrobiales bacterium]|nr:EutN/CcmL family microcompartment protein [Elusimicrobiales bacterium]
MKLAQVVGRVFCARQCCGMDAKTLLLLEPLNWDDGKNAGDLLVAADCAGAGHKEKVFYVQSREAVTAFRGYSGETADGETAPPVDAAIVGIVDNWSTKL